MQIRPLVTTTSILSGPMGSSELGYSGKIVSDETPEYEPLRAVFCRLLFFLFRNKRRCNDDIFTLAKYADDLALVARLKHGSSDAQYHCHIKTLVALLAKSFLKLNVMKTKEVCFGGGKAVPHPLKIKEHNGGDVV